MKQTKRGLIPEDCDEAEELSTISEDLPGLVIKKLKLIQINHEDIYHETLARKVEERLQQDAQLINEQYHHAGLKGLLQTKGMILGLTTKIYGIGEGRIIYNKASMIGKYSAVIRLVNFDKRRTIHNNLERDLEEFASRNTIANKEKGF